jgi:hypothetical protein
MIIVRILCQTEKKTGKNQAQNDASAGVLLKVAE